jgi:hypothetical protein
MKRQQVEGYWILKSRVESPKQDNSFSIGDRVYSIIPSTIEILAINPKTNKCDLLGIDLVEEDESSENKYELSSFLPGTYDLTDKNIQTIDPGTMKIINGDIHISIKESNYQCYEVWKKVSSEQTDLIKFIDGEIGLNSRSH